MKWNEIMELTFTILFVITFETSRGNDANKTRLTARCRFKINNIIKWIFIDSIIGSGGIRATTNIRDKFPSIWKNKRATTIKCNLFRGFVSWKYRCPHNKDKKYGRSRVRQFSHKFNLIMRTHFNFRIENVYVNVCICVSTLKKSSQCDLSIYCMYFIYFEECFV